MTSTRTQPSQRNGFDKLAYLYRWMEYFSFGPLLWRTRIAFLSEMGGARAALVLGDGDGRFTAALLRENRDVYVEAVDASAGMLSRLKHRAAMQGDVSRVHLSCVDATESLPDGRFDLVCSHFFLDCLTDAQCGTVVSAVVGRMQPSARWIVSEFAVPQGRLRWPARFLVRGLYAAFAMLTGLRVKQLPDYPAALRAAGLQQSEVKTRLGGILRSELWRLGARTSPPAFIRMHPMSMNDDLQPAGVPGSIDDEIGGASYPPIPDDEIVPSIPGDPVPNPEPEQPSLGIPDPGIYEGTGGTASLGSE